MIITIVIIGIVSVMVSMSIRQPIQSYLDVARRADIADTADTAVRRISRDLHTALPNSMRQPNSLCLEFLPTKTGGRYRTGAPGTPLDFTTAVTTFDYLGTLSSLPVANDRVVIYNLGIDGANAYGGDNMATVTSASTSSITFELKKFPFESPGNRFHILPHDEVGVFYVCSNPGLDASKDGTGILYRLANHTLSASPSSACPAPPAGTPILARNVSSCSFLTAPGVTQRSGLASIRIAITKGNETVTLYQEVHVNNVP